MLHRLYCFCCHQYSIVADDQAPVSSISKCRSCKTVVVPSKVRIAMRSAGHKPQPLEVSAGDQAKTAA
jgi:hypothetical protein